MGLFIRSFAQNPSTGFTGERDGDRHRRRWATASGLEPQPLERTVAVCGCILGTAVASSLERGTRLCLVLQRFRCDGAASTGASYRLRVGASAHRHGRPSALASWLLVASHGWGTLETGALGCSVDRGGVAGQTKCAVGSHPGAAVGRGERLP